MGQAHILHAENDHPDNAQLPVLSCLALEVEARAINLHDIVAERSAETRFDAAASDLLKGYQSVDKNHLLMSLHAFWDR